mgnify:CR=1 FL=1
MNYTVRNNYKEIGEEFVKYFYSTFDNNFLELVHLFDSDSKFTYLDQEVVGFNNLYSSLTNHFGINKIEHIIDDVKSQPLGDKTVIIQVKGRVSTNDQNPVNFVESFLLQYRFETKSFFCHSDIFNVI